jgi:hypothetical protein
VRGFFHEQTGAIGGFFYWPDERAAIQARLPIETIPATAPLGTGINTLS